MRIVMVFHGKKVEGFCGMSTQDAVSSNPTLSIAGMVQMQRLVDEKIRALGPFDAMFSSNMARALDTASVLSLALDMQFQTIKGLGQLGNLDRGNTIPYPGHENDGPTDWQDDGFGAISEIASRLQYADKNVLIVSHRPVIGALVALTRGITAAEKIQEVVNDPELTRDGYVVFDYTDCVFSLVS